MGPRHDLSSVELVINANQDSAEKKDCDRCSILSERSLTSSLRKPQKNVKPAPHSSDWVRHVNGTLLGVVAGLFLTLGCLASSFVTSMSSLQAMGLKFFFSALLLMTLIGIFKPKVGLDIGTHLKLLVLSLVFAAKFIAFSIGSHALPLAEFSLAANTVPLYTAAFGCFVRRQESPKKALALVVATAGVLTVCVPGFAGAEKISTEQQTRQVYGYVSTLFSALANAIALICLRNWGAISAMWVSFYASLVTFIAASVGAITLDELVFPSLWDLFFVALAGGCIVMQLYLPALACAMTDPSRIAISMTSAVVFSFILQATVEQSVPSAPTYVGGVLVILAMIIASVKWRSHNTEADAETGALRKSDELHYSWGRYGAVALTGSPESGRLCKFCRLMI